MGKVYFYTKIACPAQSIHRKISSKSYINLRNFHLKEYGYKPLFYARIEKNRIVKMWIIVEVC